MRQVFHFVRNR